MADRSAIYYKVDADDRIVEVGGGWDRFACQNDGSGAVADRVLGTRVYAHVKGEVCKTFVRTKLDAVRQLGKPIVRPYRCDSADCKRYMEMQISPQRLGGLLLEHRLVRREPLERQIRFVFSPAARRSSLLRCSMCSRVRLAGQWREPELVAKHLPAPAPAGAASVHAVIYSVCADCKAAARLPPAAL